MKITQALIDEHVFILQGLDFLKDARNNIEKNLHPPKEFFQAAVPFFRNYADNYHHYKEEFLMFGFLATKKKGLLDLEIGSLRHQHEIGRQFLTKIEKSIKGYEMGNEIAITSLLTNLASFVSVLCRHIFMEDHLFFPMVEKELSDNEKKMLMAQFELEKQTIEKKNPIKNNLELIHEMQTLIDTGTK